MKFQWFIFKSQKFVLWNQYQCMVEFFFITFIGDCTRYCYVYLLSSKHEAIEVFRQYRAEVEN